MYDVSSKNMVQAIMQIVFFGACLMQVLLCHQSPHTSHPYLSVWAIITALLKIDQKAEGDHLCVLSYECVHSADFIVSPNFLVPFFCTNQIAIRFGSTVQHHGGGHFTKTTC